LSDVLEAVDIKYNNGSVIEERKSFLNQQSGILQNDNAFWHLPLAFYNYFQNAFHYFTDTVFTDFNGDKRLDLVEKNNIYIFNEDNNKWENNLNYTSFDLWRFFNNQKREAVSLADLNGDSLQDFIFNKSQKTYLNKWAQNGNIIKSNWLTMPLSLVNNDFIPQGIKLIDINNDGLDDIVQSFNRLTGPVKRTFLNTGDGNWEEVYGDFLAPVFFALEQGTSIKDNHILMVDVNNDGFIDLIDAASALVYLNNFLGWNNNVDNDYSLISPLADNNKWFDFRWGEADGKRGIDLWLTEKVNDHYNLKQYLNNSYNDNLLKEIKNETGATVKIQYTSSSLENNNHGQAYPVVKKVIIDDGFAQQLLEEYEYEGAKHFYNSIWRSYQSGFSKITKKFFDGHKEEFYFHQGEENYSRKGKMYLHQVYTKDNTLLAESFSKWKHYDSKNYFVYLDELIEKKYGTGLAATASSAEKYFYNNQSGNLVKFIDYNQVNLFNNWEWRDSSAEDNRYIYYDYAQNRKGDLSSVLKSERIEDFQHKVYLSKKYYYDNLSFGAIDQGLLSKEESLNQNNWLAKTYKYNKYGLNTLQSDYKGNDYSFIYDQYHLFPIEFINPLGHKNYKKYNYACSVVSEEENTNGRILSSEYDSLCRLKKASQINKNFGEENILNEIEYVKQWPNLKKEKIYTDKNLYTEVYTYSDGFDRPVLVVSDYEANKYRANIFQYNLNALITRESKTFTVNDKNWAVYNPGKFIDFKYDALNRLSSLKDSKLNVDVKYEALGKKILLNNKIEKEYSFDFDGNLLSAKVDSGNQVYSSNYKYDILGRLLSIENNANQIRNFSYDHLGNIIRNEDMHDKNDNTYLYWTYLWDKNSNLIKKNNVLANTFITYRYDKLNRLIQEDDSVTPYLDWNYIYDGGNLAEAKLSSVKSHNYEKSYLYNWKGQVIRETSLIDRKLFISSYKYNYLNYPTEVTYPDNSKLFNTYNSQSLLKSSSIEIQGKRKGIVRNRIYNKDHQLVRELLGNGTSHIYERDNDSVLLKEKILNSKSDILYQASYIYDDFSNLSDINYFGLYIPHYKQHFDYDDLFRLTEYQTVDSNNSIVEGERYDYDDLGNLLDTEQVDFLYQKSGTDYTNAFAPRQMTDKNNVVKNFTYDKQGNIISINNKRYSWDASNYLLSVEDGKDLVSYSYDSDNQLLKKNVNGFNYYYIGNYSLDDDGKKKIYYGNYLRIVETGQSEFVYQYKDKFKNLVLELDDKAEIKNYFIYAPYGAIIRSLQAQTDDSFLYKGQMRESESDLDYVDSRFYNYQTYHWMSLDPAYENVVSLSSNERNQLLANPTWINPYNYAGNNPYRYSDEDGEWLDTLVDILSIAWSAYEFVVDPSIKTAVSLGADITAVAIPLLPASKTPRILSALTANASKGAKYVGKLSAKVIKETAEAIGKNINETKKIIGKTAELVANSSIAKKMGKWSFEGIGKGIARFSQHFVKHTKDLKNFTLDTYFNVSSSFFGKTVSKTMTEHGIFYKIKEGTDDLFFNPHNNLLVIIKKSKAGSYVGSFYKAGKAKGARLLNKITDSLLRWTYHLFQFSF